jgi:hypothetical protein
MHPLVSEPWYNNQRAIDPRTFINSSSHLIFRLCATRQDFAQDTVCKVLMDGGFVVLQSRSITILPTSGSGERPAARGGLTPDFSRTVSRDRVRDGSLPVGSCNRQRLAVVKVLICVHHAITGGF